MARYMTRRERYRRTTAHFYTRREKLFVVAGLLAVAAVLVAGIILSMQTRQDPILAVLLALGLMVWILISVFLADMLFFETI